MRVFRVEDNTGNGPYDEDGPLSAFENDRDSPGKRTARHPSPFKDEDDPRNRLLMPGVFRPFIFGFNSEAQALEWFYKPKWREALAKGGFYLSEYETSDDKMLDGYKQVMFIRAWAKLVAKYPLWTGPNSPVVDSAIDKPKRKRAKVKALVQTGQQPA